MDDVSAGEGAGGQLGKQLERRLPRDVARDDRTRLDAVVLEIRTQFAARERRVRSEQHREGHPGRRGAWVHRRRLEKRQRVDCAEETVGELAAPFSERLQLRELVQPETG